MDDWRKRCFIKEVKKYPVLWSKSGSVPPRQKELKWIKVADRFGMTVEEVQMEWYRLQQSRRAAHWRLMYTPQEKKWKYEDDMSFLAEVKFRNKTLEPIVPLAASASTSGDTGVGSCGGIVVKKEFNRDIDSIITLDDDFDDAEAEMMNIINKKLSLVRAVRDSLGSTQQQMEFVRGLDPILTDAICQYFRKFL